jgi:hypothetical protein
VRLSWQESSGRLQANDYVTPPAKGAWVDVDLGVISIPPALSGTQQWLGRIEAYGVTNDTIDVDYLLLIPTDEGYGRAAFSQPFEAVQTLAARDEFDQAAGVLNSGKTLPVGGTWATLGSPTDLTIDATTHTVQRTAIGDGSFSSPSPGPSAGRFAIAGATTFTNALVQVSFKRSVNDTVVAQGVLARYIDDNNYALACFVRAGISVSYLIMRITVAGVTTTLFQNYKGGDDVFIPADVFYAMRLVIDTAGRWFLWLWPQSGEPTTFPTAVGQDSGLATGGALASGKSGFFDSANTGTATTRSYDNFLTAVPFIDEMLFAGRIAQFRTDGAIRQDSGGVAYGSIATRGSRFALPPAGAEGRTARVAVRAARVNVEDMANANVTDKLQAQVALTPRYLQPK